MSTDNNLVTVDGHSYSKLSHSLQVTVTLNATAIRMVEDVMRDNSSDMEAVSRELGTMLHRVILSDYTYGGMRRNLKGD
jgi:hypothetical protein